jgi:hypothetical protein
VAYKHTNKDGELVGLVRVSVENLKRESQNYKSRYCIFIGEDPLYTSYTRYEAATYQEALAYTKGHRNCMIFDANLQKI